MPPPTDTRAGPKPAFRFLGLAPLVLEPRRQLRKRCRAYSLFAPAASLALWVARRLFDVADVVLDELPVIITLRPHFACRLASKFPRPFSGSRCAADLARGGQRYRGSCLGIRRWPAGHGQSCFQNWATALLAEDHHRTEAERSLH